MKIIKKIFKFLVATIMLLSSTMLNFAGVGSEVQAATFFVDEASLYSKGTFSDMITYNGINIATTFVVYKKDGKEYPAYCISPGIDGVGEQGAYNVKINSLLNDVNVWRVITNGYPYKSAQELGCVSNEEAFVATKHAVYCILLNREASWYGSIGEKGARVKNAMTTILRNAKLGTSGKPSSNIIINKIDSDWQKDESWNGYISRIFEITTDTSYSTYTVSLEGNYPEETRIADLSNNLKTTFASGEKFKIAIPIKSLLKTGSFNLKVETKLNTKPVLYGKAPNSSLQDYALTASIYEDAEGISTIYYSKNDTKLEIIKQDEKTLKKLEGVEFRILDNKKNPVYIDLITDNNGKIVLENMLPGKYYLEEVKPKDGYVKYDKQIEFDIELNQTLTIKVNNTLEKKVETISNIQNINVTNSKQEITIKDNKEYINKNDKENVVNEILSTKDMNLTENKSIGNYSKNTQNITKNINLKEEAHSIENRNANINKSEQNEEIKNINSNLNVNNQKANIDIENINDNKNINNQKANIDIENINDNKNINNQKANININNTNKNLNTKQEIKNIQNTNSSENIKDSNSSININKEVSAQNNTNINENINIQNNSTNISPFNGIVKLPKTGM